MVKPKALKEGDVIGVISPASPMQQQRLKKGVEYFKKRGFRIKLGKYIHESYGYLAGKDSERLQDLHEMFEDSEVKAIIASRGGYGLNRILDQIHYSLIAENPKILVGYSDLTAFQLAIWKHCGLVSFSGPMVAVEFGRGVEPLTERWFWGMVSETSDMNTFFEQTKPELKVIRPGIARGPLLGGCLSLVVSLLGTPHQPDFRGAILVLEDVGEQPYRIDRYLAQLRSAGIFEQVSGILLGQFVDCVEKEGEPTLTLDEIFYDYFGSLSIPVLANFLYGHQSLKFTLPIGVPVSLQSEPPSVRLLESPIIHTSNRVN